MKASLPIAVAFLTLCSLAPTCLGQAGTPYIRGSLGPAFTRDNDLEKFASVNVSGAELKYDTGVQFAFSGGYFFTDWLAAELESGVIYNDVHSVGIPSSGDLGVSQVPILVNLHAEIPTGTRFLPFFGAGVGGSASFLYADNFSIGGTTADGDFADFVFAYHAFAGLRYDINQSFSVSLGYRYFWADGSDWEPDVTIGTSGSIRAASQATHVITLGVSFRF